MRDKSSIKIEIPVPWASAPACITSGHQGVIVAGIVCVISSS
jgi:hypothetical protein